MLNVILNQSFHSMFKIINQSKISRHELKILIFTMCFINSYGVYTSIYKSFTIRCTYFWPQNV